MNLLSCLTSPGHSCLSLIRHCRWLSVQACLPVCLCCSLLLYILTQWGKHKIKTSKKKYITILLIITTVLLSVTMTRSVLSSLVMVSEWNALVWYDLAGGLCLRWEGGYSACVLAGGEMTWDSKHKHTCKRGGGRGCTAILRCADVVPACCICGLYCIWQTNPRLSTNK